MSTLIITGFDSATAETMSRRVEEIGYDCEVVASDSLSFMGLAAASGVVASREDFRCMRLLRRVRELDSTLPFIVIDRVADDAHWIEALESGATDYCPIDVDPANLGWILKNSLGRGQRLAASAA